MCDILRFSEKEWQQIKSASLTVRKDNSAYRTIVFKDGRTERHACDLSPVQYRLTVWFLRNPGEVLTPGQYPIVTNPDDDITSLDSAYWDTSMDAMHASIKRWRETCDIKVGGKYQLLTTVRSRGYVFRPYGDPAETSGLSVLSQHEHEIIDLYRDLSNYSDQQTLLQMVRAFAAIKQLDSDHLKTLFNYIGE